MKNLVFLTGAGISAESGISTFRDANGLWENHKIEDVASIEGWYKNPTLVHNFYNKRRAQLKDVSPNNAHFLITELERFFHVNIVTQNVDDLHERAGSSNVLHLHGELLKKCSAKDKSNSSFCDHDLTIDDIGPDGYPWRPDIVWFGEEVPLLGDAMSLVKKSDILVIIGTSLQVYPAASLSGYAHRAKEIYYIDPDPKQCYETSILGERLHILPHTAVEGMQILFELLVNRQYA